jgi:hypothetical protein
MIDKDILRRALSARVHLHLKISDDYARVFAEVDSFVALSHGNDTISRVTLSPYDRADPGNYEFWDKVGQGVGNLKSLHTLRIYLIDSLGEPDWEIVARILPHIQNKIELRVHNGYIEGIEDMRAFARAIQGHPAITNFNAVVCFEDTATLCSALTTLPNLEYVLLTQQRLGRGERVPTYQSPESITEFLRAPSLRGLEFRSFCFTGSLCQATAIALRQGSSITSLVLALCYFPEGGSEHIASALEENTALTTFVSTAFEDCTVDVAFYDAMAASLPSNSTLQELSIGITGAIYPASGCLSSLFLALGMNRMLRKLLVSGFSSWDGSLIPALREGLGKNSTLEILELIQSGSHVEESAFRIAAVEALQLNKTLKTLRLRYARPNLTDDEVKHLTSVVKKNYRLESLPELDSSDVRMWDLHSILRLNEAGRRYLKDGHGSVVSEGVGVLSAVSDDLNCVFLHLLENPSLCNRRAAILKRSV